MNSPNRLAQIEDLFHAALERAPAERAAFLAEACADDQSLLDAVNDLLAAHDQSWSLVDQRHAALENVNTSDPTRRIPKPPAPQAVPNPAPPFVRRWAARKALCHRPDFGRALPHCRLTRQRRNGRGLQGRRSQAQTDRCAQVPARKYRAGWRDAGALSQRSADRAAGRASERLPSV